MEHSANRINIDSEGTCVIDITKSALVCKGVEPVLLQEMELKLLMHLSNNRGHVLTKEDIMTFLWPKGTGNDYNLTQLIHKIRKIMKYCGMSKYIVTRRGVGYEFVSHTPSPPRRDISPFSTVIKIITVFFVIILSVSVVVFIYHVYSLELLEKLIQGFL